MNARLTILLPLSLALAIPLSFVGCGDDTDTTAGGSAECFDYASFDTMSPAVTFSGDVLPIFRQSCGLSTSCHQSESGPVAQPFLGPATSAGEATPAQIDKIFEVNVNVDAFAAPTMKIVKPGEPENSFLMHKMDGTLKCASVTCSASCGVSMPQGSPILGQDQRDKVRRWIAQGAKKD